MTGPQNLKPSRFNSWLMASLTGVFAGTSAMAARAVCTGTPSTKSHSRVEKSRSLSWMSHQTCAPFTAASILARERTIPASPSSRPMSASP